MQPPRLFTPIQIGGVTLPNRVVIAPMCQYSADDGCMSDWHLAHLGSMACSGAGLFVVEKTNVTREGRITHGCAGLYNDHNEAATLRAAESNASSDLWLDWLKAVPLGVRRTPALEALEAASRKAQIADARGLARLPLEGAAAALRDDATRSPPRSTPPARSSGCATTPPGGRRSPRSGSILRSRRNGARNSPPTSSR